jgi:hypothetical protein
MTPHNPAGSADEGQDQQDHDGRNDFDFYLGAWDIRLRKLIEPLNGDHEWEESNAATVAQKVLGGLGHIDDFTMETAEGTARELTLRLFDLQTRLWSIYGADGTSAALPPPAIGRFQNGVGEFYNRDTFDGQSILIRLTFSGITANSFHWEQALSADGGRTWETNWMADFTRRSPAQE